ncbi:hypothetical protein EMCRGX_G018500 [Ephydatia muelleri]
MLKRCPLLHTTVPFSPSHHVIMADCFSPHQSGQLKRTLLSVSQVYIPRWFASSSDSRLSGDHLLGECPTLFQLGEKIPVKFSSDGAKFSRTSNMMILSFSILVPQGRYLSGTGYHTIAVVKGCEDYETISKAFGI